ncbi:MAG: SDR family NAD(P)-dependent oxidoreductase [Mycobacteriales bacterium]
MPTALITGGSSGLGAAFARALAARGDDLILIARDKARLDTVAEGLRTSYDVSVETLAADLADRGALHSVQDRLADPDRPVETLINNAGYGLRSRLTAPDLGEQETALDVMCRAVLVLGGTAGRVMRERGRGTIVNMSSLAGMLTMGGYSPIKAWVTAYSEALAVELTGTGVQVTAVLPGWVRTEFHQRADIDMSRIPGIGWSDADDVVRRCLRDVARHRVLSVPTVRYRAASGFLHVVPRSAIRRISRAVMSTRHQ